jgi:hypothetical protein
VNRPGPALVLAGQVLGPALPAGDEENRVTVGSLVEAKSAPSAAVAVIRSRSEYRLVLTEHVCAGARLFGVDGELTRVPSRYSVQVSQSLHVDLPDGYGPEEVLDRFYWRFMNHSCQPNTVVRGRGVFAYTCIDPWVEVRFNYNTTEVDIAEPFDCTCGSEGCDGQVRGFRWLSRPKQERLRPWLAGHLMSTLDREPLDGGPAAVKPAVTSAVRPCR